MKRVVLICLVLAGCGIDGAPMKPSASTTISVGSDGVRTSANVQASNGTFTVGVGL